MKQNDRTSRKKLLAETYKVQKKKRKKKTTYFKH